MCVCLEMSVNAKTTAFSEIQRRETKQLSLETVSSEELQVSVKSRSHKECSLKNLQIPWWSSG